MTITREQTRAALNDDQIVIMEFLVNGAGVDPWVHPDEIVYHTNIWPHNSLGCRRRASRGRLQALRRRGLVTRSVDGFYRATETGRALIVSLQKGTP